MITAAGEEWAGEVTVNVMPALGAEFIATAAADAPNTGFVSPDVAIPWPSGVSGPATVADLLAEFPATFAGVDPSQISFIIASPSWRHLFADYMRTTENLVVGMQDTVFQTMQGILSKAGTGGSFEQRELVRQFLSWDAEGGYEGWMRRAERIARTELHQARTAAVHASATMTADAGVPMVKVWSAAHDERTRVAHAEADGQTRPVDEPFEVGGELLRYPGDRANGSAKNTIQCRCTATYVEDEIGADIPWATRINSMRDVERQIRELDMDALAASGAKGLEWKGRLAPVGEPTGDGRIFTTDGEFRFRKFPLPLLWQETTSEGHDSSRIVGTIDRGEVTPDGFTAEGTIFSDEDKVIALLEKGVIRPSVDLCDMLADTFEVEDGPRLEVHSATIMAATLVAKPAFENVGIQLTGDESEVDTDGLVASAGAVLDLPKYDSAAFADPGLDGPTPITVTPEGRVFGHLALWDTCHVGQPGKCVTPPRSAAGYAHFHQSTVLTDDGPVAVGRLTVGGGHAGVRAGVRAAAEHYDTTGSCWAFVRAGEDKHGIWVAGEVNQDAPAAKLREAATAPLSGDWRRVGNSLELVAALSVSTPGFPVRREYVADGQALALCASGWAAPAVEELSPVDAARVAAMDAVREVFAALRAEGNSPGELAHAPGLRERFKAAQGVIGFDVEPDVPARYQAVRDIMESKED